MNGLMMALLGGATGGIKPQDVFSTDLYTGDGAARTITTGIDLSGGGGLVWIKARSTGTGHRLVDTERGATKSLESNSTNSEVTESGGLTAFNADGFDLGSDADYNASGVTFVGWTFRQAAKFFDVVTYTGDGSASRNIVHNLGSAPGVIVVKRRDSSTNWAIYHRSRGATKYLFLESTTSEAANSTVWSDTEPTDTQFTVGSAGIVNAGGSYIAYLFAHDTSDSGIVQAGQYTGNGSSTGPTITLGWQPQWVLIKRATGGFADWYVVDTERGIVQGGLDPHLRPNQSAAEPSGEILALTVDGFQIKNFAAAVNNTGDTYVYLAIRKPI